MKHTVLALALLVGCGGGESEPPPPPPPPPITNHAPSWAGKYAGTLGAHLSCTDGTTTIVTDVPPEADDLAVDATGFNVVTFDQGSNCPFTADVTATTATVRSGTTCTQTESDGGTVTVNIQGGSYTLSAPNLTGRLDTRFNASASITCTAAFSFNGKR
jgi:hypothetical protein